MRAFFGISSTIFFTMGMSAQIGSAEAQDYATFLWEGTFNETECSFRTEETLAYPSAIQFRYSTNLGRTITVEYPFELDLGSGVNREFTIPLIGGSDQNFRSYLTMSSRGNGHAHTLRVAEKDWPHHIEAVVLILTKSEEDQSNVAFVGANETIGSFGVMGFGHVYEAFETCIGKFDGI